MCAGGVTGCGRRAVFCGFSLGKRFAQLYTQVAGRAGRAGKQAK